MRNNYKVPYKIVTNKISGGNEIRIMLSEDVTFLNKASILNTLNQIPDNCNVIIDGSNTQFIHHDIFVIIEDFKINAVSRNIKLSLINLYSGKRKKPLQHFEITEI